MIIKKITYIILITVLFLTNAKVYAKNEIYVDLTVNEKIITNFDIQKEINYLKIINPQLQALDRKQISKIGCLFWGGLTLLSSLSLFALWSRL